MNLFECDKCGKKYSNIGNLNKHLKKDCSEKYKDVVICDDEITENKKFNECLEKMECCYCGKTFAIKYNIIKHIKMSCKIYNEKKNESINNNEINNMRKELNELKAFIENLYKNGSNNIIDKNSNQITNNNTNNNTNTNTNNSNNTITNSNNLINNQQNIVLVGHGKENLDAISKGEYVNALEKGFNSIVKLTELIHFNKKYPENQNIYIPNEKQKVAKQYDGKRWISVSKKKLIEDLFYDKRDIVCEKMEEYSDNLSGIKINALNRMLESDNTEITKIKDDLEMLLYNNRDIIKATNQIKN
jgi:hypothetical protein